jgi:hypothetical protein
VGASGVVSISTDGTNWTESASATANNLRCIIYANGQYIAVGDNGTLETSGNGINWVLQNSGTASSLSSVAFSNGKYVAAGASAVIASSDTITWSPATSGLSAAAQVAGGSNGFVAVNGTAQAYFSTDGLVWTSQTLNAPRAPLFGGPYNALVTHYNGVYLIASYSYYSSLSVDYFMYSSTNGTYWTTNFLGNMGTSVGFTYKFFMNGNGNVISGVQVNGNFLISSPDAVNWTVTYGLPNVYSLQGNAGAFGNGNYVIVAPPAPGLGFPLPQIFTSTDGTNWVDQQKLPPPPVGPNSTFTSIVYSNGLYVVGTSSLLVNSTNGLVYQIESNTPSLLYLINVTNGFVGVGAGGLIYQSGDGLSWTQRNSGTLANLHAATTGGPLQVAVGDNGTIQTSPNGLVWTSRTSGTSLMLIGATYANGTYVATGQLGTVLTSPDGINWTGQFSGVLTNLYSVIRGPTGFLAVGSGGTVITSPDGVNWTQQNSGASANLYCVTFGSGYYLATGDNAAALASTNGVNWVPLSLGAMGGQTFYGCSSLNGRFDVVGSNGTVLESDVIAPVMSLRISPSGTITIYSTSGSNFRLQSSANLAVSAWTDVASFTNVPAVSVWTNTISGGRYFYRTISP